MNSLALRRVIPASWYRPQLVALGLPTLLMSLCSAGTLAQH